MNLISISNSTQSHQFVSGMLFTMFSNAPWLKVRTICTCRYKGVNFKPVPPTGHTLQMLAWQLQT